MKAPAPVSTGRIIVADDQPLHLSPVEAILTNAGYEVITAANGREVLEKAAFFAPDLFLLDVDMPELDGFETCCCLKDDPNFQEIPVIFMSAEDDISAIDCAFELGGIDFLAKPFNRAEMLVRVRSHLRAYHERRQFRAQVLADAEALRFAAQAEQNVERESGGELDRRHQSQGFPMEFRRRGAARESQTSDVLSLLGGTYLRAKRKGISLTMPRRPDEFTLAMAPNELKRLLDSFSDHFLSLLAKGCGCHVKLQRRDPGEVCIQFASDMKSYGAEAEGDDPDMATQHFLPDHLACLAGSMGAWAEIHQRGGLSVRVEIVLPAQF